MMTVITMNERNFEVINGGNDNSDLTKPIEWVRADKGEKVMSLHPTALKATMSERRLHMIAENAEAHPEIEVTYSKFDEGKKRMNALREMLNDDKKIIAFNKYNKKR